MTNPTNISTTSSINNDQKQTPDAKTIITVTNSQQQQPNSFYVPLNQQTDQSTASNINKIQVLNSESSGNIPNGGENGNGGEQQTTNGLVRRLSVTARPGDIFYKVKDVTESCSTTDGGLGYENGCCDDLTTTAMATTNHNLDVVENTIVNLSLFLFFSTYI